jgi:hypothetical protein
VAAGKAAPDLKAFLNGLRGTIKAAPTGFPALRRLLRDDLTPLLSRLGGTVDGQSPYLAHFNPIVKVLGMYKHEITAFLGNSAAATNLGFIAPENPSGRPVKVLRLISPLTPESVASFSSNRVIPNRSNPYFKPGGYSRLQQGLQSFANTPCGAGIDAKLAPKAQVVADPNFKVHTRPPLLPGPIDLYNRIKSFAFGGADSTAAVPAPPCVKQGKFKSIGRFPEFSSYLHVRRDR